MATIDILGVPHAYDLTTPTQAPQVLVFIHGWLLSRNYWQPLIGRLAPEYQCLSYDLRGFGGSNLKSQTAPKIQDRPKRGKGILITATKTGSRPLRIIEPKPQLEQTLTSNLAATPPRKATAKYTPAAYAEDLEILLQQLGITSAWLIGHSLGGSIGLWGADRLGSTIKGVVCINAGGGIYLKEEFERFRAIGQRILKFRPRLLAYLPLVDLLFSHVSVAQPVERRWGRQRLIDFIEADPEAALGALLDPTTEAEVHLLPQVVARLKQPVHFIAGKQDSIMEPRYVTHLASFHSTFQSGKNNVTEISNCGHMAMVEQPAAIATQLQAILRHHL